jgi:hypothetical protein
MRTTLTNQIEDKSNTDKKNKEAKEAAEMAINESNRNYKEEQNKRRLELRAAEKAEKLNDIVRH